MTANLVWHSEAKIIEHTITFTNTTHPEFEVEFPESITVEDGESVALPSVSGSFEDSGYEYTPLEWSIGSFGESFTPTEDVTANLVWKVEEINPEVFVFLPASGRSFSGYNTECAAYDLDGNSVPWSRVDGYVANNTSMVCVVQYSNSYSPNYDTGYVDKNLNVSQCIAQNSSGNVVWKSTKYYQNDIALMAAFISEPQGVSLVNIYRKTAPFDCYVTYSIEGKYFILDGVHKNWIEDIDSEGFQLTPIEDVGYLERRGGFGWQGKSVSGSSSIVLHEAVDNGSNDATSLPFADNKSYNLIAAYNRSGTDITSSFTGIVRSNYAILELGHNYVSTSFRVFSARYSYSSKLPTVERISEYARFASTSSPETTIQPDSISVWLYTGAINSGSVINKNDNYAVTVAVCKLTNESSEVVVRTGVEAVFDNTNGGQTSSSIYALAIKNNTQEAITCKNADVYRCFSNLCDVIVVTVYNSSNESFNAFKYSDDTDYYYVLDGVQENWVSDLSSIGYGLTPEIPTVTQPFTLYFNKSGSGNYYFAINDIHRMFSSGYHLSYDDTKSYAVQICENTDTSIRVRVGIPVVKDDIYLALKNDIGGNVNLSYALICQCSSKDAEVVTVYDSQNTAYNSFKFKIKEIDYYYVLDGIQTDWTDDLSSIGYSLTKNLPTVQNVQCWLAENKGSTGMSPPSFTTRVFDENNNRIPYSSDLLYCVFLVSSYPSADGEFYVVNSTNTTIAIYRENGTGYINIYSVFYASCSDKTAIIIDVYDSQNNVFKAFKYTLDGVDYYRVMEWQNTHPDWVSDLSSIGYSLSENLPIISELTLYTTNETHYWQFGVTNATQTVDSRYVYDLYTDNTCTTLFNGYDVTKLYLNGYIINNVWKKSNIQSILDMPSETTSSVFDAVSATILQTNSKVWFVSNYDSTTTDGSNQHVLVFKVCSSNEADVITVYNSNNEEFSAFKYVKDGTDYYYVLDGVQNEWTEDLSSIGYSLIKTLPTVSMSGEFGENNMLACASGQNPRGSFVYISANSTEQPYIYGTDRRPVYDVNKTYATVYAVDDEDNRIDATIVGYVNDGSSNLLVKNLGNKTILYNSSKVAACSSNESEVVTVYNLSNEAFNAFKYNLDGTDYYYILDDIQTEWTDNLDKIGYSLIQFSEKTLYFHYKGSEMTILREQVYSLYDGINTFTYMPFSSLYGKKSMKPSSGYGFLVDSNGKMGFTYRGGDPSQNVTSVTIAPLFKVYFTTQGSSATDDFTFHGGTITNVYDSTGNTIPYDSSKTYIKYAVYNIDGQIVSNDLTNSMKFINNGGYLAVVREWMTYDSTTSIFMVEYFE